MDLHKIVMKYCADKMTMDECREMEDEILSLSSPSPVAEGDPNQIAILALRRACMKAETEAELETYVNAINSLSAPVGGDDATKAINEIQAAAGVMYDHLNKVNGEIAINGLSQIMEATLLLRRALSSPPAVVSNKTQNTVHKDSCDQQTRDK